ncbi:MAG: hypothetical protein OEZ43_05495 [Gammaproteobacteria bacterium]|nr:hypothetical protein [Gammaproteobacteria bacterium]
MGRIAKEQYSADLIFHCDADEFWTAKSGNLKNELLKYPLVDCLRIDVRNVLLEFNNFEEQFPKNAIYVVENPLIPKDIQQESLDTSFFLFAYPTKVIYKVPEKYSEVTQGNHRLVNRKEFVHRASQDITIYHYPVRNRDQFHQKVIAGGSSLERNTKLSKDSGWHWRRWYESYKKGNLDLTYKQMTISPSDDQMLISNGIIRKDSTLSLTLCKENV